MGNQCIRDGSDDEAPAHHHNANVDNKGGKKGHNKYEATDRIVSLEHVEHPHAKMCENSRLEKNFREFSRVFVPGEAALCVASCDTHPSGMKQLLTAGEDKSMSLLNYETGHVLKQWRRAHERDINHITNPHKTTGVFCTASRDTTLRLWKTTENAPLHTLKGHKLNVTAVTTNPDGTMVASGSRDNSVRLWDVATGEQLSCQDVKLNIVHFVRWLAPLNCIAQGGEDLTLRLWDVRGAGTSASLELQTTLANFDYHPICCEGYSDRSDAAHILYTGHNGFNNQGSMILEWDLRMGRQVRQFDGHGFTVRALRILRSSTLAPTGLQGQLVSASDDGTIRFWPLEQHNSNPTPPATSAATDGEKQKEEPTPAVVEKKDQPLVHVNQSMKFELQEGKVTCMDESAEGLLLMSLRNGTLLVLKPSGTPQDPRPVQRYRYVGNPAQE